MVRVLCCGSFMLDLIASDLPRLGTPGDLVYAPNGIQVHTGGHAANVAIDLAQLGRRDVAATGGLGADVLGDFFEGQLREYGLKVYPERMTDYVTSKNIALVLKGEDRRFIAELAANTMLSPEHVVSILEATRPDVFYMGTIGGLKLLDGHVDEVLNEARWRRCLTVVDVVRPENDGWRKLVDALPLIDVLHCNDIESKALTGHDNTTLAVHELSSRGVKVPVVTKGSHGLVATFNESILKVPAFKVRPVDPTGAGDAFCAGMIDSLIGYGIDAEKLRSAPLDTLTEALVHGAACGAACVTQSGATTAVTREIVDDLMSDQREQVSAAVMRL